jgi:hypothetical protein
VEELVRERMETDQMVQQILEVEGELVELLVELEALVARVLFFFRSTNFINIENNGTSATTTYLV